MRFLILCSSIFFMLISIVSCSTNNYNPTVFEYDYNTVAQKSQPIKNIMIIPINFGVPSRHYLKKHEKDIDKHVETYLKDNDYSIISNRAFLNLWKKAIRQHGDMFNPNTGMHTQAFKPALIKTITHIFTNTPQLDAVIFTDLISVPVKYQNTSNRTAQWLGVQRKVKVEGLGSGVSGSFNWNQSVDGTALAIRLFNREQQQVLYNIGGLQIAQALVVKNNGGDFRRRRDLFHKTKEVAEGIAIAFHPLIDMKNYPSTTK